MRAVPPSAAASRFRGPRVALLAALAAVGLGLALLAGSGRAAASSHCTSQTSAALIRDCRTLIDLKAELDPGGVLNWAEDLALDSWDGIDSVSSNPTDGVTKLVLRGRNLSGTLPAELSNLPNLTRLWMNGNPLLSGEIPAELGNLTNLTHLELAESQLSGEIPAELAVLPSLTHLWLHENQLSGAIPTELADLTNLQVLYLPGNQLTGAIPSELGNLTNLRDLTLGSNQLTGEIPAFLGDLTTLTQLDLSDNQLTGEIPAFLGNLTNLESLYLWDNQLTGGVPTELGDLTALTTLFLDGNQLSGRIPVELTELTSLTHLYLHDNKLTGAIPTELGDLTALELLYLDKNQLTGAIPDQLGSLAALAVLGLSCNQLSGSIPSTLGDIASLVEVRLQGNPGLTLDPLPANLQRAGRTVTLTGRCRGDPPPAKSPAPRRVSVQGALTVPASPVPVGETFTYTLAVSNDGDVGLTGVRWRSAPALGVPWQPVGGGALAVNATVTVTGQFATAAHHLPGPLIVTVYLDSDQTDEALAGSQPVALAAPEAAGAAARGPARGAPSLLALRVTQTRFEVPDTHLAHNTPDLALTLSDGSVAACDFLTHYDATGALARWGWAISEVLEERPGSLTQYYQRGVVDCHEREGEWLMERRLTWDHFGGGLGGAPDLGVEPELLSDRPGELLGPWGHRVSNYAVDGRFTGFLDFFEKLGGVAAFGYPKSEARWDDDPRAELGIAAATPGFIRQYFQAAVMEHHWGLATPVMLRLLGQDLRDRLYVDESYTALASFGSVAPLTVGQVYLAERVVWSDPAAPAG